MKFQEVDELKQLLTAAGIFTLTLDGMSCRKIAVTLNEEGVLPTQPQGSLRRILQDTVLKANADARPMNQRSKAGVPLFSSTLAFYQMTFSHTSCFCYV
ncbi:MAG: recombinase family protein [Clostridiales bacterium]|nr:recombinase family protein [Clostridiales bacterium]